MLQEVLHIGLTVSDMDRSINFYKNVLGLAFQGELLMEGEKTDRLFAGKSVRVRVAYLNGSENIISPPIELIQFLGEGAEESGCDLHRVSISEVCFRVADIDQVYESLKAQGVECLSGPQDFDFTGYGFGKSRALYFKDPDGIILELMQPVGG
ncbi:VOC family protein [[Clostridium] symbiosum]|uniref:VOC family protein n=1 Tax=Clostridium symbiosum TaxID=1512 RepID=UPI001D07DCA7|nr:VOC family protein [[Clostridium] symbiosum]MCB6607254.1 VOC family protein [[Clostridium] symbiosum]MCB6929814.1 VOC family protein [[Clostridium] symbiosum]